ncbi:hypothetical protein E3N88_13445 [Mikania micrantha]|uniref:Reverse transcriptase Ty1/copia-type domain-containing protein n=1 Tax=Mikania micrantha TaxID=192012 RepID=A0A5N6PB99_9ASTR|nr:hypothetical protein E3N88_13445 [Mikania micrantha]
MKQRIKFSDEDPDKDPNEFNSVISRLASVDINFEDEIQALLLLSSLPDSWSGTVTAVSSSSGTTKLTFDGIRDIILSEDIRRRSSGESSSTLLNTEGRGRRNERGHSRGSGSTGVDTDDDSVSGSTGNDSESNDSGSNGSESSEEEEDSTSSVQSSSIPGSSVPQPETQHWWEIAMKEEMKSLEKNRTWVLTKLPSGKKALQNKWVYRIKDESNGSKRYKARLVVKGFQQKEGVDYNEIFSPVVKMTTIRLVLSIVASENLHLEQLDVKTAFLHGDLDEDIYMAPRQWYLKFDNFMGRNGFKRCEMDHCCYIKKFSKSYIILLLYVDDMLIAGSDMKEINKLKKQMSEEFEMKDLGAAKQILGMSIFRNSKDGSLTLSQEKYIGKVLEKFSMKNARARNTPLGSQFKLSKDQCPKTDEDIAEMAKVPYASAVGSLMYAMVCTRPDIAHAVGVVSRYMSNPGKEHWEAVKWLLRYLKGTSKMGLCFKGKDTVLRGYTDADLGGCKESYKSTTGYVFSVGGTAVSWMSRLQRSVALSTTEVEYMAAAEASKELIWLKNFLEELGKKQPDSPLYCDNQSAIHLGKNPVFHGKTKHIQLRYHFIRGLISDGTLMLEKIRGTDNPADMLTKTKTSKHHTPIFDCYRSSSPTTTKCWPGSNTAPKPTSCNL